MGAERGSKRKEKPTILGNSTVDCGMKLKVLLIPNTSVNCANKYMYIIYNMYKTIRICDNAINCALELRAVYSPYQKQASNANTV